MNCRKIALNKWISPHRYKITGTIHNKQVVNYPSAPLRYLFHQNKFTGGNLQTC